MNTKTALVISGNKYPQGDASAVRQHAFALLLRDLGYAPRVIGFGDYTGEAWKTFEGIPYRSLRAKKQGVLSRMWNRLMFGRHVLCFLRKEPCAPDVILLSGGFPNQFRRLEKYAKKNNVILLYDSVEWYSKEEYAIGALHWEYHASEYINRCAVTSAWRVIAISRFLQSHFQQKGCKTVRIPSILDVQSMTVPAYDRAEKFSAVYAGNPGRKDDLAGIIRGFLLLSAEERARVQLTIIGPDASQLIRVCGLREEELQSASDFLKVCGRVPRDEVLRAIQSADCTVLLRNEALRFAKAGFPTKVAESLACGTPVMCNLSTDLADYLREGENAFLIAGHTPQAVAQAARRLISASGDDLARMRKCARATAEENFDYRLYRACLRLLLEENT